MARLPQPGSDVGTWGDILNDYLSQSLTSNGSLQDNTVGTDQIQNTSVTKPKLATSVQTSLDKADSALQTAPVTSVNSQTGTVTLTKSDIGLGNVDNTSDSSKPISTAQQTALDGKVSLSLIDAKGDLLVGTADDTLSRLVVGSDNSRLIPDSSQAGGHRYSTGLLIEGTGSPNTGAVVAPVGSLYQDLSASPFGLWFKQTGSGGSGWLPLTTADISQATAADPGASQAITSANFATAHVWTLSQNFTLSLGANPSSSIAGAVDITLKQPGAGGPFTVTFPALGTLPWAGGASAPVMPTAANAELNLQLKWTGVAWRAFLLGTF